MADNRTLDEFGTSKRDDSAVEREVAVPRCGTIDDAETPVEPDEAPRTTSIRADEQAENRPTSIESTIYRWDPDGTCAACGGASTRLWRDREGFVCPSCKRWSG